MITLDNIVIKLKDLGDNSYKEIGTVGDDSKPVIWSKEDSSFPLFLAFTPDFVVKQSNSETMVECQAIFLQDISMMCYGWSDESREFSKDIPTRFSFDNFEKQYGGYSSKVVVKSLGNNVLLKDGILVTIHPYGNVPNPYDDSVGFYVLVQVADELLQGFISAIQSSPNNIEASLNVEVDNWFVADNMDGVMLNLIDGAKINSNCYFSFRTGGDSGQKMTQLLKQRNSIKVKLKRLNGRRIGLALMGIAGWVLLVYLFVYLFEPYIDQFSEWLNSIGL